MYNSVKLFKFGKIVSTKVNFNLISKTIEDKYLKLWIKFEWNVSEQENFYN